MKIAFITEMGFKGKIPRTHMNMRTEFAWMCALAADHYHFSQADTVQGYDLVVLIIPKKKISDWIGANVVAVLNRQSLGNKEIAVMQEGPSWFFQDYTIEEQIWYYNTLVLADKIFVHNQSDKKYFEGITGRTDLYVLPSLMITDLVEKVPAVDRKDVIIGGNFVSWYGGFDSYIVANELGGPAATVYATSMGRKQAGEDVLVKHLPYMNWVEWISALNKYKYGVHMMRTHAAGTFALNCAYLGIPCIGYKGLDTQEICHPNLSVDIGDIQKAKELAQTLKQDAAYYTQQSLIAKKAFWNEYCEEKFLLKFNKIYNV